MSFTLLFLTDFSHLHEMFNSSVKSTFIWSSLLSDSILNISRGKTIPRAIFQSFHLNVMNWSETIGRKCWELQLKSFLLSVARFSLSWFALWKFSIALTKAPWGIFRFPFCLVCVTLWNVVESIWAESEESCYLMKGISQISSNSFVQFSWDNLV